MSQGFLQNKKHSYVLFIDPSYGDEEHVECWVTSRRDLTGLLARRCEAGGAVGHLVRVVMSLLKVRSRKDMNADALGPGT
jgi:hypothetical protein